MIKSSRKYFVYPQSKLNKANVGLKKESLLYCMSCSILCAFCVFLFPFPFINGILALLLWFALFVQLLKKTILKIRVCATMSQIYSRRHHKCLHFHDIFCPLVHVHEVVACYWKGLLMIVMDFLKKKSSSFWVFDCLEESRAYPRLPQSKQLITWPWQKTLKKGSCLVQFQGQLQKKSRAETVVYIVVAKMIEQTWHCMLQNLVFFRFS